MNERFEQLARQAEAAYIPRYDMWQMDSETVQQFAELIIAECISACATDRLGKTAGAEELINERFGT